METDTAPYNRFRNAVVFTDLYGDSYLCVIDDNEDRTVHGQISRKAKEFDLVELDWDKYCLTSRIRIVDGKDIYYNMVTVGMTNPIDLFLQDDAYVNFQLYLKRPDE